MLRGLSRAVLFVALATACSSSPQPPPKATPSRPPLPAVVLPPPLPPARWTSSGGATLVGPKLAEGTLVLVGGRRALVAPDGSVKPETVPLAEPVVDLVQVPRKDGGTAVVGRGARVLYRFDDPVGPPVVLARSDVEISSIGAGPGLVALWDRQSDVPRLLDVETGKDATIVLPPPPLRALAFTSAKEGAAVFQAVGLAVTSDGGASWKPVAETHPGDALRVGGVRVRGGSLCAFQYAEGREAAVDVATAKLGPFEEPASDAGDAPLLRWIRATGRDPLEAAVSDGVPSPRGGALVASHGLLARVDLATGLLLEMVEVARGPGLDACHGVRVGDSAFFACALAEGAAGDLYDPFGILRVSLSASPLAAGETVLTRNGAAELRASPSGGLMLTAPCNADEEATACVRQPNGTWTSIRTELDPIERGLGPLADGRIVGVRGLWPGDVGHGEPPDVAEGGEDDAHPLTFVAVDPAGRERALGPPVQVRGELRVTSPAEEGDDGTVTIALASDNGPIVVSQKPGHEALTPARVEGADEVRLHAGRGIAIGRDAIRITTDGGETWTDAGPSSALLDALHGAPVEEVDAIAVGEVGVRIFDTLRIGWGPADAPPAPSDPAPLVWLKPRTTPAAVPSRPLTCTSDGPSTSAAPLLGTNQVRAALGTKTPPPKGTRRDLSAGSTSGTLGMLGTIALLEEEGPDKPGSAPAKWTLRWQSGGDLGARAHTWSGPPPKSAAWGSALRSASSDGSRALLAIRSAGRFILVRTSGASAEMAEVPFELLPSTDAVFGRKKGDPIVWLHDTSIVAWRAGEAPKVIGSVAANASRTLGVPTADGVPILVSGTDWALSRVFSLGGAAKPKKGEQPPAADTSPTLVGWTKAPNLRKNVGSLAACDKDPTGARFSVTHGIGEVRVDGHEETAVTARYEVVVDGDKACVASVAALVQARPKAAPPPASAGQKPPPPPVSWVRADFVAKRAEGGDRGLPPAGSARRLSCKLDPPP